MLPQAREEWTQIALRKRFFENGERSPVRIRLQRRREGAEHGVRANVICPGFVRTPLVERQIPELSRSLGMSEADVIKKVMLKETVDGEFTTTQDIAAVALMLATFPSNALTGQSVVVSHGWHME